MFINKLNQLFKPSRILFYTEASPEEIQNFYKGQIPENIAQDEFVALIIWSTFFIIAPAISGLFIV